jgi:hypothetical protein
MIRKITFTIHQSLADTPVGMSYMYITGLRHPLNSCGWYYDNNYHSREEMFTDYTKKIKVAIETNNPIPPIFNTLRNL